MIFGQERKVISIDTIQELCNVRPTAILPKKKEIRTVSHIELKQPDNILVAAEPILKVENARVEEITQSPKTITSPYELKRLNINNGGEDILWL